MNLALSFIKKTCFSFSFLPLLFLFASPVQATKVDGLGPWADRVVLAHQGLTKAGLHVPAIRSKPRSTLGEAEGGTIEGQFYSLGFGGKITLYFRNGIQSGVFVVESTNPHYPLEKANVEVSPDKINWFTAGTVSQDGQVQVPTLAGCIHYVRVTDISNPADFSDATADGYDVDGVKGTGDSCITPLSDEEINSEE